MPLNQVDSTRLIIFDKALLHNKNANDFGLYVAAISETTKWRGGDLFVSFNQILWENITAPGQSIGGYSTDILPTHSTAVVDVTNTLSVRFTSGVPTSNSDFLPGVNVIVVGNELLQFKTATLISGNNYELTELIRGLQGTSTTGHTTYEDAFIVNSYALTFVHLPPEVVGESVFFKLVPPGYTIDEVFEHEVSFAAKSLKPLEPTEMAFVRADNDDITFSWNRSTRANAYPLSGNLAPVLEEKFQFILDLASGTREVEVNNTTSYTYTAALQTADGLTPGNAVLGTVKQAGTWLYSNEVSINAI